MISGIEIEKPIHSIKKQEHFNMIIVPDLSNRIDTVNKPKPVGDLEIIGGVLDDIYPEFLCENRINAHQQDRFILEFTNQKKIFLKFDLVLDPNWLHLSILPKHVLIMAYKKLSNVEEKHLLHTDNVKEIIKLLKQHIDNYNLDEHKYKSFTDMVNKRDNYRKVKLENYMPELAKEILQ